MTLQHCKRIQSIRFQCMFTYLNCPLELKEEFERLNIVDVCECVCVSLFLSVCVQYLNVTREFALKSFRKLFKLTMNSPYACTVQTQIHTLCILLKCRNAYSHFYLDTTVSNNVQLLLSKRTLCLYLFFSIYFLFLALTP